MESAPPPALAAAALAAMDEAFMDTPPSPKRPRQDAPPTLHETAHGAVVDPQDGGQEQHEKRNEGDAAHQSRRAGGQTRLGRANDVHNIGPRGPAQEAPT